ncbi:hypothetical protein LIER_24872 [Lithospermum erythrorhizon]|uniref:Integrase catalytic domain-containing protein n=1 Tax=Lithospermum erythrorhizon TaxID=34254 RepID=A0AAV3R4X9_LITER
MKNTRAKNVEEFIWKNIITRYGIPKIIVSNNDPQLDATIIIEMCQRLGFEHRFALVCYPQYNCQVEVMNMTIFLGIKKNLLESGANWYEELHRVLWSYQTIYHFESVLPLTRGKEYHFGELYKRSQQRICCDRLYNSPFSLVYGAEAVLPLKVCLPNVRQICFAEDQNQG